MQLEKDIFRFFVRQELYFYNMNNVDKEDFQLMNQSCE